ncbi:MAG: Flp pilus assembly protein CpaB [Gammaproteobacteria bacterium]|nr:MAG: Flp pilus assembly protein CpaB [Gammaproteobacteria bacterium]
MKPRVLTLILIAVILAGGAALLANKWLQDRMMVSGTTTAGMVPVAAAAVEIPFGQKIELAHIKFIEMPEASLPKGIFTDQEAVIGKIVTQNILPGEILLEKRVVKHLGGSTLAAVIASGMRAMTVRVDDVMGVAGFLLPGNRVDVLSTKGRGNSGVSVRTLLQDMKVLAVDQTASTDKNDPVIVRAVTLEVTPRQAEILVKATREGKVQLSLRNPVDDTAIVEEGEKPAPKKAASKKVIYQPRVTVVRGTQVTTSTVQK